MNNLTNVKKYLLESIKTNLPEVKEVILSKRLVDAPCCLSAGEGLSFEMERVLQQQNPNRAIKAERILEINPNAKVEIYKTFYMPDSEEPILDSSINYVVDAIDTITVKWELMKLCLDNDIEFISSMGMGNREDLTKINITTLDKTNYVPVAKKLREFTRKDNRYKGPCKRQKSCCKCGR